MLLSFDDVEFDVNSRIFQKRIHVLRIMYRNCRVEFSVDYVRRWPVRIDAKLGKDAKVSFWNKITHALDIAIAVRQCISQFDADARFVFAEIVIQDDAKLEVESNEEHSR